jgi:hypothetical protein
LLEVEYLEQGNKTWWQRAFSRTFGPDALAKQSQQSQRAHNRDHQDRQHNCAFRHILDRTLWPYLANKACHHSSSRLSCIRLRRIPRLRNSSSVVLTLVTCSLSLKSPAKFRRNWSTKASMGSPPVPYVSIAMDTILSRIRGRRTCLLSCVTFQEILSRPAEQVRALNPGSDRGLKDFFPKLEAGTCGEDDLNRLNYTCDLWARSSNG